MSLPWKRCIIVGASSGIGEAIAKRLAKQGVTVALVARRNDELLRVKSEVEAAGGHALVYPHDVANCTEVAALFQQIAQDLGGLDLVVYAAGVMPIIEPNEYCLEKDLLNLQVNAIGAVAWLNEAAQRFERAQAGTIVGISSVAGDRGRRGYPVYGATKAFLDNYLESLRNRVARFGVSVVTIKPGPVDTPMTRDIQKKPLLISADAAAEAIIAAAAGRKRLAYVPGTWRPIMFIIRNIPSFVFRKLNF